MKSIKSLVVGGALAAATLAAVAPAAHAANLPCSGAATNVIYVGGSTATGPVIKAIDQSLVAANAGTIIVYANAAGQTGSCTGVNFFLADATPTGACATGACPTGTGQWFDAAGVAQTCDLPTDAHLDVVVSDVFLSSCPGAPATMPADAEDVQGPIQAMLFVVPKLLPSPQLAITAAEAYFVFGFGGTNGMASPWLDATTGFTHQYIRNKGSGTQQMTGRAAGLPGSFINQDKMKGTDAGGSGGVATGVGASTDASTIGILAADVYDLKRDTLRSLAFKAFKQWFAYYPDSSPTAFDKINVRDGHYNIWGPIHFFARVSGSTTVRPNAKAFFDILNGVTPTTPPVLDIVIGAHVIPQCAMKVSRTSELGPIAKYTDAAPCGCYFEQKAAGSTTCTACNTADGTACAAGGVCRHKFCEAN